MNRRAFLKGVAIAAVALSAKAERLPAAEIGVDPGTEGWTVVELVSPSGERFDMYEGEVLTVEALERTLKMMTEHPYDWYSVARKETA